MKSKEEKQIDRKSFSFLKQKGIIEQLTNLDALIQYQEEVVADIKAARQDALEKYGANSAMLESTTAICVQDLAILDVLKNVKVCRDNPAFPGPGDFAKGYNNCLEGIKGILSRKNHKDMKQLVKEVFNG